MALNTFINIVFFFLNKGRKKKRKKTQKTQNTRNAPTYVVKKIDKMLIRELDVVFIGDNRFLLYNVSKVEIISRSETSDQPSSLTILMRNDY